MTTRERSSRSGMALGIFYFSRRRAGLAHAAGLAAIACLWYGSAAADSTASDATMVKRRQPGILTGMPFMPHMAARTFVDDAGRKLFLAETPRRIASLAPSVTEMLFALGAEDRVAAVTSLCDYPPEAAAKPKVSHQSAALETIVALRPDLIIAPHGFMSPDVLDHLERFKVPVMLLRAQTVDDVFGHLTTLGRLLDRQKAADDLVASLRARVQRIKTATQNRPHPRALYVLNMEPLITVGPQTFLHHLIELAGGSNVAHDGATDYPRLSMETVLARNPDVLIFPTGDTEGIPEADRDLWRRWPTLNAVKTGRFVMVSSVLLDRPGPRLIDGLERLAYALHPEAFPEAGAP